jgi:hypothetical protein
MITITMAAHSSIIEECNHLAACLTGRIENLATFRTANYTDGTELYAVSAPVVSESFLGRIHSPLEAPEGADIVKAQYALDRLIIAQATKEKPQQAEPGKITVYMAEPESAMTLMGLSVVPMDSEEG